MKARGTRQWKKSGQQLGEKRNGREGCSWNMQRSCPYQSHRKKNGIGDSDKGHFHSSLPCLPELHPSLPPIKLLLTLACCRKSQTVFTFTDLCNIFVDVENHRAQTKKMALQLPPLWPHLGSLQTPPRCLWCVGGHRHRQKENTQPSEML